MRLILIGGLTLLSSCSFFKDEPVESLGNETKPKLVGRISHVPADGGFVLIESYGPWRVPDGGLLTGAGSEGRTANLVATGEKLGQHAAADLRSGVAKVGDSVYFRPLGTEEEGESVDSPASPPSKPEDEAQKNESQSLVKP